MRNRPATGRLQTLDARHRAQAHVEDRIQDVQACGAERLPSLDWGRHGAWLQLAALAPTVLTWLRLLALDEDLAKAEPEKLRYQTLSAPARATRHARARPLSFPTRCGRGELLRAGLAAGLLGA